MTMSHHESMSPERRGFFFRLSAQSSSSGCLHSFLRQSHFRSFQPPYFFTLRKIQSFSFSYFYAFSIEFCHARAGEFSLLFSLSGRRQALPGAAARFLVSPRCACAAPAFTLSASRFQLFFEAAPASRRYSAFSPEDYLYNSLFSQITSGSCMR